MTLAIHESGHVVAAWAVLGQPVTRVKLEPDARTSLASPPASPLLDLLWRLAGPLAAELAFGYYDQDGARSDAAHWSRAAHKLVGDLDELDRLVIQCRPVMRSILRAQWETVERVADALLSAPGYELRGIELERLCPASAARGTITEDEPLAMAAAHV